MSAFSKPIRVGLAGRLPSRLPATARLVTGKLLPPWQAGSRPHSGSPIEITFGKDRPQNVELVRPAWSKSAAPWKRGCLKQHAN